MQSILVKKKKKIIQITIYDFTLKIVFIKMHILPNQIELIAHIHIVKPVYDMKVTNGNLKMCPLRAVALYKLYAPFMKWRK